jgi:hypothetical protein
MRKLSQIWFEVQEVLFPFIEKEIEEPLTGKLRKLVTIVTRDSEGSQNQGFKMPHA